MDLTATERVAPCTNCGCHHPETPCPFEDSPLPYADRPGEARLGGKYKLLRALGAGGLGIVFEAENEDINRKVAIKVLHREYSRVAQVVERFRREARAAGGIGHEHIVEVLDLGRTDTGSPFIVMEILHGRDLGAVLAAEGALVPQRVVDVGVQVLLALEAAHARGIVHRDLKPENVFLTTRGDRADFVKLVDFGIALVHDPKDFSPRLTKTGAIMGTPYFMSPEQLRGDPDIDHRTDLYSLGVMMYELLSGRNPYGGKSYATLFVEILGDKAAQPLDALRGDLPPGLSEIVMKSMAKPRDQRFATAREMIDALRAYASAVISTSQSHPPPPTGPGASLGRPGTPGAGIAPTRQGHGTSMTAGGSRRKPLLIGLGVGAVALVVGIAGFALIGGASSADGPTTAEPATAAIGTAPPATAAPAMVAVRLLVTAPGAIVTVDGQPRPGPLVSIEAPVGSTPKTVHIEAPNYVALDFPVSFDSSREVSVPLTPALPMTAAPAVKKQGGGGRPGVTNPYD